MKIEEFLRTFGHYLTDVPEAFPWFVALLLGTGILVTLRFGFIQFYKLGHAFQVIAGHFDDPNEKGDVTHFQALTVALSATVGVGNIAGVALAIHVAGPGALFWMWMTAFFGMALKYVECTLSMKYRIFDEEGEAAGGPMYYIEKGLGWKWAGMVFAFCAVICSFATGNMNQSNTIASVVSERGLLSPYIVGGILVFMVGFVIIGGVKRIASVTDKLLPGMAFIYFGAASLILILHIDQIPAVIALVFANAFNPTSAFGGTAAGAFTATMLYGIKRGLFSNEAGQGSAPIAHASAKTHEPVREGVVAMVGPFIDTLIICSLTGLVLLVTGAWNTRFEGEYAPSRVVIASEIKAGIPQTINGPVELKDGIPQGFVMELNHASIEDAVVLKDSQPYSGILESREGYLQAPDESFHIKGKALLNGAPLTTKAFEVGLSKLISWGSWIVEISVFLFAFSTIIGWSYYGDRSFEYLFGIRYLVIYRLLYLVFVFIGAIIALDVVWMFGDIALSLMAIPNLIAIIFLHGKVLEDTKEYFSRKHVPLK
jgi:alanine or glycine:cation symporter, AGCS family